VRRPGGLDGSLLLCAGEHGLRFALPNARVMLHQRRADFGQASDIQRHAEDILKIKRRLNEIYEFTGKDYDTIERTLDRDHFMTAARGKDFGIIDKVQSKRPEDEAERRPKRKLKDDKIGARQFPGSGSGRVA